MVIFLNAVYLGVLNKDLLVASNQVHNRIGCAETSQVLNFAHIIWNTAEVLEHFEFQLICFGRVTSPVKSFHTFLSHFDHSGHNNEVLGKRLFKGLVKGRVQGLVGLRADQVSNMKDLVFGALLEGQLIKAL